MAGYRHGNPVVCAYVLYTATLHFDISGDRCFDSIVCV